MENEASFCVIEICSSITDKELKCSFFEIHDNKPAIHFDIDAVNEFKDYLQAYRLIFIRVLNSIHNQGEKIAYCSTIIILFPLSFFFSFFSVPKSVSN